MIHSHLKDFHEQKEEIITNVLAGLKGQKDGFGSPFLHMSYSLIGSCQFVLLREELQKLRYDHESILRELTTNGAQHNTLERCSNLIGTPNKMLSDLIESLEYLNFYPKLNPPLYTARILIEHQLICTTIGQDMIHFYGKWLNNKPVIEGLKKLSIPCIRDLFSFMQDTFLKKGRPKKYRDLSSAVNRYYRHSFAQLIYDFIFIR